MNRLHKGVHGNRPYVCGFVVLFKFRCVKCKQNCTLLDSNYIYLSLYVKNIDIKLFKNSFYISIKLTYRNFIDIIHTILNIGSVYDA